MACTCTEEKEVLPNGAIIGRNRVECSECKANREVREKERQKQNLLGQMKELEDKIYYSTLTGDIDPESGKPWAEVKKERWAVLRQQLLNLEA